MPLGDFLKSVKDSLRGGWSPAGTVIIAVSVVVGLMALGVLHVYLKSRGIVVTAGVPFEVTGTTNLLKIETI